MADSPSPLAIPVSGAPSAQPKRRATELNTGGKKKAKTRHLSSRETSKSAERVASRRHQALEREFSKAQRLLSSGADPVPPAPLDTNTREPPQPNAAWTATPLGDTEQAGPSHSSPPPQQGPQVATAPALVGATLGAQGPAWSQAQFQAFMQHAFTQFMTPSGTQQVPPQVPSPPNGPSPQQSYPPAPESANSEASSQTGEGELDDLDVADTPISDEEEAEPDQASASCLFDHSIFTALLSKACSTAALTSVQEEKSSTSADKESNPLFKVKAVEHKQIPCPFVFRDAVEAQWASLSTMPRESTVEKKLYNVAPSFASLLEVPSVDSPLTSLFSNSAASGDMTEFLSADEKKFEANYRRAHLTSGQAIKAATGTSFFARTSIMWLRELQATIPPDQSSSSGCPCTH